ncbi:MAG: hypothetical protein MZV70_03305 [Desulfobacterales bacterium]|nr:hypothetical protein [Desulfobacterales bacterium]
MPPQGAMPPQMMGPQMTHDLKHIKAQLDEVMGTDAYDWLLGEINNDANNVLICLASEPDPAAMRYKQGEIYGLKLALDLLKDPFKRLDKAAGREKSERVYQSQLS